MMEMIGVVGKVMVVAVGVHLEDDEVSEEIKKVDLEQDEGRH